MGLLHLSASCKQKLWLSLLIFSRIVFIEQALKIDILSLELKAVCLLFSIPPSRTKS